MQRYIHYHRRFRLSIMNEQIHRTVDRQQTVRSLRDVFSYNRKFADDRNYADVDHHRVDRRLKS